MPIGGRPGPRSDQTVVADAAWGRALLWIVLPILGAGAGWLLKLTATWAAGLTWVPFQGPLRLLRSVPEPYATIGSLAVGAVAGLVLAFLAVRDQLAVTVSGDQVMLVRGERTQTIAGAEVTAVFLDGKQLVLLGRLTEELAREQSDLGAQALRDAFVSHGFQWQAAGDPHAGDFRRWVDGTPDLPPGAEVLLRARGKALDKGDTEDVADLRRELGKLGIVVREEKKRQYWRRVAADERS